MKVVVVDQLHPVGAIAAEWANGERHVQLRCDDGVLISLLFDNNRDLERFSKALG